MAARRRARSEWCVQAKVTHQRAEDTSRQDKMLLVCHAGRTCTILRYSEILSSISHFCHLVGAKCFLQIGNEQNIVKEAILLYVQSMESIGPCVSMVTGER